MKTAKKTKKNIQPQVRLFDKLVKISNGKIGNVIMTTETGRDGILIALEDGTYDSKHETTVLNFYRFA